MYVEDSTIKVIDDAKLLVEDSGALLLVHGIPLVLKGLVKVPIELLIDKEIVELKGEKVEELDAGASGVDIIEDTLGIDPDLVILFAEALLADEVSELNSIEE